MKFSDYLLTEDASAGATGSGSIGGTRGVLFSGIRSRNTMPKIPVQTIKYKKLANWNGYKKIHESDNASSFSSMDVVSKLNAAQKHNDMQKDAVVYGIEDENGAVTKVYVARDQDEEFKQALDNSMRGAENKHDVAEILFDLRHSFNILHVEWPPIPEDEEVNVEMDKDKEGGEPGKEGEAPEGELPPGAEEPPKEGEEGEVPEEPMSGSGGDDQSILFKVIDMLKADAEAKTAEANARAKEAEAKEAGHAAKIADHKVKSEEEYATADSYFKQKKENKVAADRLSKLAKYRQEIAQSSDRKPGIYTNESLKEDAAQDVAGLQAQLAQLQVKRMRATKVIDDQIRIIQQQLAVKTKQTNQQTQQQQPGAVQPAVNQTASI